MRVCIMINHWKFCAKFSTSIPAMYFMGKFIKPKDRNDNENHHNENHYKLQFLVESNSLDFGQKYSLERLILFKKITFQNSII